MGRRSEGDARGSRCHWRIAMMLVYGECSRVAVVMMVRHRRRRLDRMSGMVYAKNVADIARDRPTYDGGGERECEEATHLQAV